MRAGIIGILLFASAFSVSAIIKTKHLPQGYFSFEECMAATNAKTPNCYRHTIRINRKQVLYQIDGTQTKRRFICDLTGDLRCLFKDYGEDDSRTKDDRKAYQELFHLEKLPGKFLFTKFLSPADGKLVKKKYRLERSYPSTN